MQDYESTECAYRPADGLAWLFLDFPWAGPLYFLIGVAEPIVQTRFKERKS